MFDQNHWVLPKVNPNLEIVQTQLEVGTDPIDYLELTPISLWTRPLRTDFDICNGPSSKSVHITKSSSEDSIQKYSI